MNNLHGTIAPKGQATMSAQPMTPATWKAILRDTQTYGQERGLPIPLGLMDVTTPQIFGTFLTYLTSFTVSTLEDMLFDRQDWQWQDLRLAVKDVTPTGLFHLAGVMYNGHKARPEYHTVTREQLMMVLRLILRTSKGGRMGLACVTVTGHPEGIALYQERGKV